MQVTGVQWGSHRGVVGGSRGCSGESRECSGEVTVLAFLKWSLDSHSFLEVPCPMNS